MSRIFWGVVLAATAIVNAAESQPKPRQVGFKPWRWAKALDKKLGEVSIEMSAVKDGKPLNSEKKRDAKASQTANKPVEQKAYTPGGQTAFTPVAETAYTPQQ